MVPRRAPNNTQWQTFATIDPDGNITATGRTWILIAGILVWMTMTYAKLDAAADQVAKLAQDVSTHREVLIQAGLLLPSDSAKKDTPK